MLLLGRVAGTAPPENAHIPSWAKSLASLRPLGPGSGKPRSRTLSERAAAGHPHRGNPPQSAAVFPACPFWAGAKLTVHFASDEGSEGHAEGPAVSPCVRESTVELEAISVRQVNPSRGFSKLLKYCS